MNGEGGFTHSDVYNMPVSMRNFYIKCLLKHIKDKNAAIEKSNEIKKPNLPKMPKVLRK